MQTRHERRLLLNQPPHRLAKLIYISYAREKGSNVVPEGGERRGGSSARTEEIFLTYHMKIVAEQTNQIVLRFDPDDELVAGLTSFLQERGIGASVLVSGVGSAKEIEISWYNLATKTYERKTIVEDLEVLSLSGNTALFDGKPIAHIHGVFGRRDLSTFGGHVHRLVILATAELVLSVLPGASMHRAKDETTGLNLLQ